MINEVNAHLHFVCLNTNKFNLSQKELYNTKSMFCAYSGVSSGQLSQALVD